MSGLDSLPLRDDLRGISAYGAPQVDVPVRLNTNENPYGPSDALVASLAAGVAAVAKELNRYPDRDATELRGDLARYLGRSPGCPPLDARGVWAANGSNEVLQQVLQAFGGPGRVALGFEPSYSMHQILARGTGTEYRDAGRGARFSLDRDDAVAAVVEHRPDVVFLCSPNNPTGEALDAETVVAVYDAVVTPERGIVILDEAYVEFSHGPSLVSLLPGRPRLIVSRTMSKAFAFAGARVGYLAADPSVVEALALVRLPYHLSAVTQAVARVALAHVDELQQRVDDLKGARDRIVIDLRGLGLDVIDSDANFVLFGGFPGALGGDQRLVWERLLDHGVLVRDVGLPGWLRVTAGTAEETSAFLTAMAAVCEEGRR